MVGCCCREKFPKFVWNPPASGGGGAATGGAAAAGVELMLPKSALNAEEGALFCDEPPKASQLVSLVGAEVGAMESNPKRSAAGAGAGEEVAGLDGSSTWALGIICRRDDSLLDFDLAERLLDDEDLFPPFGVPGDFPPPPLRPLSSHQFLSIYFCCIQDLKCCKSLLFLGGFILSLGVYRAR